MNMHVDVTCSCYLAEEFPSVSAQFMSQDCPKHFYYLTHKMYWTKQPQITTTTYIHWRFIKVPESRDKLNLIKKRLDSLFRYHCLPMIKQLSTKSNSNVLVSLQMIVNSWALTFVLLLGRNYGYLNKTWRWLWEEREISFKCTVGTLIYCMKISVQCLNYS